MVDPTPSRINMECKPQWESMVDELLGLIFQRLSNRDLISVSFVCQSWCFACLDLFFLWNRETLDLSRFDKIFKQMHDDGVGDNKEDDRMAKRFRKLLEKAMEGGRFAAATSIIFPPNLFISSKDLLFMARRTPKVRKLSLPRTDRIFGKGFPKAIRWWREMEEASVMAGGAQQTKNILHQLGINSPNLRSLHIHGTDFHLDRRGASVLINGFPLLNTVGLKNSILTDKGCGDLVVCSPHLERLIVVECIMAYDPPIRQNPLKSNPKHDPRKGLRQLAFAKRVEYIFERRQGEILCSADPYDVVSSDDE